MPTSPPETTSSESRPSTWPNWAANSEPPSPRISWPAPCTMLCISGGTWVSRASVSASAIDVDTGSAISFHTGSVASTHSPRVIACGAEASSEMVVASPSHRLARLKASTSDVRAPPAIPSPSLLAMCSACCRALCHGSPANMPCICDMNADICAGSIDIPPIPDSASRSASGST